MSATVLVVEDNEIQRKAIIDLIGNHDVRTTGVGTGKDAIAALKAQTFDCTVVDLGLPDMSGMEVIPELRKRTSTPIIVLSVRDGQADKVEAFEAGADDYVTKPFGMPELLARMRAVRRRAEGERRDPVVRFEDLGVDLGRRLVRLAGEAIHLTPTEYGLLEACATNPGKLLTHRWLLQRVWGPGYATEHQYLRVFIRQLRAKLGEAYRETSAAFIWATAQRLYAARRSGLKEEMFGYVPGGYARVLARFVEVLAAEQTPEGEKWFQGTADAVRQATRHFRDADAEYYLILAGDEPFVSEVRRELSPAGSDRDGSSRGWWRSGRRSCAAGRSARSSPPRSPSPMASRESARGRSRSRGRSTGSRRLRRRTRKRGPKPDRRFPGGTALLAANIARPMNGPAAFERFRRDFLGLGGEDPVATLDGGAARRRLRAPPPVNGELLAASLKLRQQTIDTDRFRHKGRFQRQWLQFQYLVIASLGAIPSALTIALTRDGKLGLLQLLGNRYAWFYR